MEPFTEIFGKKVHFIGIGGVSMSGIAKCFLENGIIVQGSDSALEDSKYIQDFNKLGIKLFNSHKTENITNDISLIVITSTVTEDNPEIIQAKSFNIPILERFEVLEKIISQFKIKIGISGSSGKTTTTALCWEGIKSATNTKPSCIIGTILNETNSSVFINKNSQVCVVEADESDGSFADMNFTVAIITDIDTDHLDHKRYQGNPHNLIEHFRQFATKTLKNGGIVIYNINCKTTAKLIDELDNEFKKNKKIFSYSGIDKVVNLNNINNINGDYYLEEAKNLPNAIKFSCNGLLNLKNITIPMIGKINAFNAIPSLIICQILFNTTQNTLFENFKGANKRIEIIGTITTHNQNITIIDDYAHSPKKIKAFIESFASYCQEINANFIIICEPHKYSRVENLYNEYITCFDNCTALIMMEIFGIQGRNPNTNISSHRLVDDIQNHWKKNDKKFIIKNLKFNKMILLDETFNFIEEFFEHKKQIFYVFLGAGYSNKYAHLLYDKLKNENVFKA